MSMKNPVTASGIEPQPTAPPRTPFDLWRFIYILHEHHTQRDDSDFWTVVKFGVLH
jgi:hypothetical protein